MDTLELIIVFGFWFAVAALLGGLAQGWLVNGLNCLLGRARRERSMHGSARETAAVSRRFHPDGENTWTGSEQEPRGNPMKLAAPRYARITYPLGTVATAIVGVVSVLSISRGQNLWWLNLTVALFCFVLFGWWSYLALFVPVVQLDSDRLAWRAMVSRKFQEVPVKDLVGCRMQDAFELRLQLRSGEERSVHLSQIARHERPRLIGTIEAMVNKGAMAV